MLEEGTGWGQSLTGSIIPYTRVLGGSWREAGRTQGSGFSFDSPTAMSHENKLKIQHIFSWCYSSRQAGARSHTEGDRAGPPAPWGLEAGWYMEDGDAQGHMQQGWWRSPASWALTPAQPSKGSPERF